MAQDSDKPEAAVEEPASMGKDKAEPLFDVTTSRQFPNWLAEQSISLAFTTYQAGKLFFIGLGPE